MKDIERAPPELKRPGINQWWKIYLEMNMPWFILDRGFSTDFTQHGLDEYQIISTQFSDIQSLIKEAPEKPNNVHVVLPKSTHTDKGIQFITLKEVWEIFDERDNQRYFIETIFVDKDNQLYSQHPSPHELAENYIKEVTVV